MGAFRLPSDPVGSKKNNFYVLDPLAKNQKETTVGNLRETTIKFARSLPKVESSQRKKRRLGNRRYRNRPSRARKRTGGGEDIEREHPVRLIATNHSKSTGRNTHKGRA